MNFDWKVFSMILLHVGSFPKVRIRGVMLCEMNQYLCLCGSQNFSCCHCTCQCTIKLKFQTNSLCFTSNCLAQLCNNSWFSKYIVAHHYLIFCGRFYLYHYQYFTRLFFNVHHSLFISFIDSFIWYSNWQIIICVLQTTIKSDLKTEFGMPVFCWLRLLTNTTFQFSS